MLMECGSAMLLYGIRQNTILTLIKITDRSLTIYHFDSTTILKSVFDYQRDYIYKFMNSFINKSTKELFIIKLSMESKWVAIVREKFEEEKGSLDLNQKKIGDRDIPDIIEACRGVQKQIKGLNLYQNNIRDQGAKYLSAAHFPNLTELWLGNNKIGGEGAKYLSAPNFPNLILLNLYQNNIRDEGAKYISTANFPNLTRISLYHNKIGDEGAKYLSTANFPKLTELSLANNNIGAEGAKYLSAANFPNLTELRLNKNNIKQPNKTYLKLLFKQKNFQNVRL